MSTLFRTTVVEGKLFLREPMAAIFGVLLPTVVLLTMGAVPALREPSTAFEGARFVEFWAPTALAMGIGILGLQHIPGVVAGYRENGVLRRMSTTPVHPATVLVAQMIVALAAATVAAVLLVVTAWLLLDVPLPRRPAGFALAFLLGFGAVLAIGMLIAAVAPTVRVASGLAVLAYMVTMFTAGVFLPRFLMPEPLVRIGDYAPPGIQALLETWTGAGAGAAATGSGQPLHLGMMAVVAVAAGGAAAKLFRWE